MQHALNAFLKADEFDVVNDHTGMLGLAFGGLIDVPFCHTVHGPLDGQPGRLYDQVLEAAPSAKLISISMNQRKPGDPRSRGSQTARTLWISPSTRSGASRVATTCSSSGA